MMTIRIVILFFLTLQFPFSLSSQSSAPTAAGMDSIEKALDRDDLLTPSHKLNLADTAFKMAVAGQDECRQIYFKIKQATYLDHLGMPDSALVNLYWASERFKEKCDSTTLLLLYTNLTSIYLSLREFERIDSIGDLMFRVWNPAWKNKEARFAILNNLGIAKVSRDDAINATTLFRQAYQEADAADNFEYIKKSLINLGSVKGYTGDVDSAYFFFNKATVYARKEEDMVDYMSLLINLANINGERKKYTEAIRQLDSAYVLADTLNNTFILSKVQHARADLYVLMGNYEKAYRYLRDFVDLSENYLDEERVKAVTEMMEKYESEKKARLIQQLEVEKLDSELRNERVINTRNRFMYIGAGVLLMAIALWTRLLYVRRSRTALQKEKDISEGLLLNILPGPVAHELKTKGYAEARHFSRVTILFSDFKGFTTISEELTATELVEELNACFMAFDEIMTKYGIEKIKTIGDAYMAAGNIPDMNTSSPIDVVNAGLDMQEFVTARKKERDAKGLLAFEMRVGIHSGPVVAGIVGVKKFQYDLWGDSVNTASRMESNGEVGKVNISDATYQLITQHPSFTFTPRGKLRVKGKDDQLMFFVHRSLS